MPFRGASLIFFERLRIEKGSVASIMEVSAVGKAKPYGTVRRQSRDGGERVKGYCPLPAACCLRLLPTAVCLTVGQLQCH